MTWWLIPFVMAGGALAAAWMLVWAVTGDWSYFWRYWMGRE